MKIAKVQFVTWDRPYDFSPEGFELVPGDKVIVKTETGIELGEVVSLIEADSYATVASASSAGEGGETADSQSETTPAGEIPALKVVLRKATPHDIEKVVSSDERQNALLFCRQMKEKLALPMKFIDAYFSLDGSRITFAFIADGRVDFRELVKDLTRHFGRTIRLQQIGIRDEAKVMGDYGHCGQPLCCKRFLRELSSITSEMAELQQCSHRGSERISGICGRLMCCLAYEENGYEELVSRLVPIGAKVSVDGKKGTVVGHHVLKQSVNVQFNSENGDDGAIVEVDLNRHKKGKSKK
ncbi:MAG: stage 0 sporulation protein [Planctomycetes bacterium]|jgi:cell fate regulator YaaT (PSP1 superfamily)|nr:stage 0 sporulation protein [Planctomycetota bacterium]